MGRLFSWLTVRLFCGRCASKRRAYYAAGMRLSGTLILRQVCAEAAPDALILRREPQRQEPRQRGPQ